MLLLGRATGGNLSKCGSRRVCLRAFIHSRGTSLTSQTRRHNEAGRPAGCAAPDQTPLAKVRYIRESRARWRISSWVSRQSESLKSSPVHFSPFHHPGAASFTCSSWPQCRRFVCFFFIFFFLYALLGGNYVWIVQSNTFSFIA